MPNFFICSFIESVGLAKLAIAVFKAVPACEPLIPAFAIKPTARAVSSTLNPNVPANGATYLNVSPIKETFVFALDDVFARTSAKCDESSAFNPKAVNASVTISLVFAKLHQKQQQDLRYLAIRLSSVACSILPLPCSS